MSSLLLALENWYNCVVSINEEKMVLVMKMDFSLNLVQTQKLIMTPELRQAIEILQYNSLELKEFIQEELMNNPVLDTYGASPDVVDKAEDAKPDDQKSLENVDIDWKELMSNYEPSRITSQQSGSAEQVNFDAFIASEDSLTEHLLEQLNFTLLNKKQIEAGTYIIENIDDNGYLTLENGEVAERFGIDEDDVEDVIQTIQMFEPAGVGARDLKECLLIQVQMREIENKLVIDMINHYLDELARNRIGDISKKTGQKPEAVQEAADIIRTLEPKPGRLFASMRDVRYIIPDVNIEKVEGEYVVIVNDQSVPRLRINKYYQKILRDSMAEKQVSEYIQEKLQAALRVIRSIEQRRNTIFRVVTAIIEHQREFFDKGTIYLKPLTLKEIAEKVGVHESTVSRAVNGKYLQCPRGVFEIKYFFQSGVSSAQGDGVSAESIKSIIQEMVSNENPKKPLSDQRISNELNKIGIKVSRRTIAKYRDELGIPGSSKRKRYD